ncbi:MAG: hypothetical protein A3K60_08270 [Euryarchaeota archaeon RBG_19FT_COMBO_56_21]|nr:MAG: hypothetical protein A3K60_08270 [Euryarchaeota archaeon RBG_19FT_COMBO_56_21]
MSRKNTHLQSYRLVSATILLCLLVMAAVAVSTTGEVESAAADSMAVAPPQPTAVYSYMGYSQIRDELLSVEAQHPGIAKVYDIGDSWEKSQSIADRDILALKISDNVLLDEDEPEVLVVALHHAREWISSEIVMEAIRNMTDGYGTDSRVSWLVDNRELWLVPVVNPDGIDYALSTDQWWRKNRRYNFDDTYGVDLNRNYGGSLNNDSAGAWGGVGSSHVPSSDVYCGVSPFSEPETQAIRNLVIQRNFTLCLDFHSYGELVMWPWGYTANLTSDNAALVSIGTQLAALNGYTADQSVGLYPTTGDSIDWFYGYDNIFAILFEVATVFHPQTTQEASGVIAENMPPILLGIEIAGDRQQRQFAIAHLPVGAREYSASGFDLWANITADRGVDESAISLNYRIDGGLWVSVPMAIMSPNDTYLGAIPAQQPGCLVEYYIVAHDTGGVELMSPRYAPYEIHSFTVVDSLPPVADAGDDLPALVGSPILLNASASNDNTEIVSYTWTFSYNGSQVVLYGEVVAFTFWVAGSYEVLLNVSDSSGNYNTDIINVNVEDPYIPEFGSAMIISVSLLGMLLLLWLRRNR